MQSLEALESIKVLDERGTTQKIFKDNIKFIIEVQIYQKITSYYLQF